MNGKVLVDKNWEIDAIRFGDAKTDHVFWVKRKGIHVLIQVGYNATQEEAQQIFNEFIQ